MESLDDDYAKKLEVQTDKNKIINFKQTPSIQSLVSMMRIPSRTIIYSNSSAFLPIDEHTERSTIKMSENSDDVFDHEKL